MKTLFKILLLLFICTLMHTNSVASITVDSVSTVKSSCTNNGSATIYAHSTPASTLLYAIVAGPSLAAIQNSKTFSSLYPGTYTARIYTAAFDSTDTQFQIAGNYQLPNFTVSVQNPTCPSSSDGSITIVPDTNSGLQPFLYSMISPSVIAPQSSPYFPNLNANSYLMRVTDACGNYQTRTGVLTGYGTGLATNWTLWPSLTKVGCDTMLMNLSFSLYKEKYSLPLTLSLYMQSGTVTKTVYPVVQDTINQTPGSFYIIDTIPNLTYGDILSVSLTDTCGDYIYSYLAQVAPYDFEVLFNSSTNNCSVSFTGSVKLKYYPNYPYHPTGTRDLMSFTLTDNVTGAIVDSMTNVFSYQVFLKEEISGHMYHLTITDGCGEVWQQDIQWPSAGVPTLQVTSQAVGCMDSTGALSFQYYNFLSPVTVTLLSGPTNAHSTKAHYEYSDTITYPREFTAHYSPNAIWIKDCPAGNYTYIVSDTCGNSIQGSYYIDTWNISNLLYTWYVKPSCLNNNTLFHNFQQGTPMAMWAIVTDVATNTMVAHPQLTGLLDSITTLPIGQYALEIYYGNHQGNGIAYDGSLINDSIECWVLHDTISILPYANNFFLTNNTIFCNGTNYVELIPDSTRGVPPYKFEIISGPQIFPQQDSAFFQIQQFGNYVISMEDVCGNNYTQQITVSSDSFPPIVRDGFLCAGNNATLSAVSSAYFSYVWQYPNGTSFSGDSISFNPFTIADTGMYHIQKIVNINGCRDTLASEYYLSANDSVVQTVALCQGDSVSVGSSVYHLPGIYRDTLSSSFGCDSLVITTVSYSPLLIDSNIVAICNGDSVQAGNVYYTNNGTYVDTLTLSGGCKKIIITQLTVSNIVDSISATICHGGSFSFGTIVHNQEGIFRDTLTAASGCDSIVIATITFSPMQVDSTTLSICNGDSVAIGNVFYSSPGNYTDTITLSGGCKKLKVTQLAVSNIVDSVTASICHGGSFSVGTIVHNQAGIFRDTLTAANGCDSVVIATITFSPMQVDSTTLSICNGDSVAIGNIFYSSPGNYADTITLPGGCKKLMVTQLAVSNIVDSISATICHGGSFSVGTIVHNQSGIFNDTLTAASGCDSVVISTIAFSPMQVDSITLSICNGDSAAIGNIFYSSYGIYADTVALPGGCKKLRITQLSVNNIVDSINATICHGGSFSVGIIVHNQAGVFNDTLTAASGCDSIVIATIDFTPMQVDSTTLSICNGDSVAIGNIFYSSTGNYTDTITLPGGCKKLRITQLTVNNIVGSISATICHGGSITVGTVVHNQAGVFRDTLTSANGCDSVVIATINFLPMQIDSTAISICKGATVSVGNNIYFTSGVYADTITMPGGCKKIIVTQLTVTTITNTVNASICQGTSYSVGAATYQIPGVYHDTLMSALGCDSIVITTLSFAPIASDSTSLSICNGNSITVGNHIYFTSGTYTDTITLAGGCKKLLITQLDVTTLYDSINASICYGEIFKVGNIVHQQSGIFNDTLSTVTGCDSVVIVNLQVTMPPQNEIYVSADTIEVGHVLQVSSRIQNAANYYWHGSAVFSEPYAPVTNVVLNTGAWIYLLVTNAEGCSQTDSVFIFTRETPIEDSCDASSLYIPNAFTPNNDGVNDVFKLSTNYIDMSSFRIFNRWGQIIFESANINFDWNGMYDGAKCAEGVYYYSIDYKSCRDGKAKQRHGSITLLR